MKVLIFLILAISGCGKIDAISVPILTPTPTPAPVIIVLPTPIPVDHCAQNKQDILSSEGRAADEISGNSWIYYGYHYARMYTFYLEQNGLSVRCLYYINQVYL